MQFLLEVINRIGPELEVECETVHKAVAGALRAMFDLVPPASTLPGDIAISVTDAEESPIALISVTFSVKPLAASSRLTPLS
jgi:hypothetical protein